MSNRIRATSGVTGGGGGTQQVAHCLAVVPQVPGSIWSQSVYIRAKVTRPFRCSTGNSILGPLAMPCLGTWARALDSISD